MLPEIFSGRKYWRLFLTVKSFNWAWQKKILGWKVWSINLNSWNPSNFLSCCPQLQEKCTLFPTPILMLFLAPQIPGEVNYCFSQAIPRAQPSRQGPCSTREAVNQGWKPLCDFLGCVVPTVAFLRENVKGELVKVPLSETRFGQQCKRKIQRAVFVIHTVVIPIITIYIQFLSFCSFADWLPEWLVTFQVSRIFRPWKFRPLKLRFHENTFEVFWHDP